jgi:hypothetical protein
VLEREKEGERKREREKGQIEIEVGRASVKGKGKVHPRTGHGGTYGEQMYSSTLSLTSALNGGRWLTPLPVRFTPGKDPVPIV